MTDSEAIIIQLFMVPTAKEILFSRTFLGQSIQDLKVINQDIHVRKEYHI